MTALIPLKQGDLVVCVDNSWPHTELRPGAEYTVAGRYNSGMIWVEEVPDMIPCKEDRFQLMSRDNASADPSMPKKEPYRVKTLPELDAAAVATQAAAMVNVAMASDDGKAVTHDMVNLPYHYARFKIEPLHFAVENNLNALQFNILKYMLRYDAKNGDEDLAKMERCGRMLRKWAAGDTDWWKREEVK